MSFISNIKNKNINQASLKARDYAQLNSIEKLSVKYLFHNNFIFNSRPLVIGEGRSDTLHLKTALYSLYNTKHTSINFSHLEAHKNLFQIMKFGGGTDTLIKFITNYKLINKANVNNLFACIILVDGDKAGTSVVDQARKQFNKTFEMITPIISANKPLLDFYHVINNLYIMQLPNNVCIEHLYDPLILRTKIGNRTFNPSNKNCDKSKHYTKIDLYNEVIFPNKDGINFSNFQPIIDTILHIQNLHLKNYNI